MDDDASGRRELFLGNTTGSRTGSGGQNAQRTTRRILLVDSRLRKPVTLNHAIQRLTVLDAIVEDPDLVWLGTTDEKAAHLLALTRITAADLPHVAVGEGEQRKVRYFPDRLPIGIRLAGRGVVVYVVTDRWLGQSPRALDARC